MKLKLKGHTRSSYAPNMVQFRLLFPELRHFEKNGACHFSLIGRHLESASSTKLVFELVRALVKEGQHANFGPIQAIFLQL